MTGKPRHVFESAWLRGAALVVALVLVAGINILWLRLDQQANRQADWVDHTHQVMAALQETLARAGDMSTGHRGYAMTHEQDFLQPYRTATNQMPLLLGQLRKLTEDNPDQAIRLNHLAALINQHEKINQEHIDALVKSDPSTLAAEFPRAILTSSAAIHTVVQQMMNEESNMLLQRRDELKQDTRHVTMANIASGLVSVGLLLGVVQALWRENRRRRVVETQLQQSHEELQSLVQQRTASLNLSVERLRLAQQAARIGAFEWNLQSGLNVWSPELEAMYGLAPGSFPATQSDWEKMIHPDDRTDAITRIQQALATGAPTEGEWRVVWPDGSIHWLFGRFQVFKDAENRLFSITGVNIDITERKRLEQETVEASEREMRRIGHDLHDSVGQQLTALSLFVYSEQKIIQVQAPQRVEAFKRIASGLRDVVQQIRVLSHGLSPISVEDNGLAHALRKLAADTRLSAQIDCDFEETVSVTDIDPQQAVQLYRIGQEAVTNALKHGQAQKIHIALEATNSLLALQVSDNGRGFSITKPNGAGLGLRAMKYRADLIGAALQIDSNVNQGTRITCAIHKLN